MARPDIVRPPNDQLSVDEAIRLMKSGLAKALMETAAKYVIPIFWLAASGGKPMVIDSGSAFMLDCGEGPFVVTAYHVYQGYRASHERYPDAISMLGDVRFDLDARHIASDQACEVATFRICADDVSRLAKYAKEPLISGFPMAQIRPLARRRGETAPTDTEFLPLPSSSAATG